MDWLGSLRLDDKKLKELWDFAKYYAISRGFASDACDFAQEFVIAKNNGRRTSIENLFIDYLRKHHEDRRGKKVKPKKEIPIGLLLDERDSTLEGFRVQDGNQYILDYATKLKDKERCIFLLYYIWGMTEKEIGFCFGITGSSVSLKLKTTREFLNYIETKKRK